MLLFQVAGKPLYARQDEVLTSLAVVRSLWPPGCLLASVLIETGGIAVAIAPSTDRRRFDGCDSDTELVWFEQARAVNAFAEREPGFATNGDLGRSLRDGMDADSRRARPAGHPSAAKCPVRRSISQVRREDMQLRWVALRTFSQALRGCGEPSDRRSARTSRRSGAFDAPLRSSSELFHMR